jgi:hypothetical protein
LLNIYVLIINHGYLLLLNLVFLKNKIFSAKAGCNGHTCNPNYLGG